MEAVVAYLFLDSCGDTDENMMDHQEQCIL
jgi:hypothetical protein